MSRIGKQPVEIPDGVDVKVDEANLVTVRGPRGELTQSMHPTMRILTDAGVARVERPDDIGFSRSLHGLTCSRRAPWCATSGRTTSVSAAACTV